MVAPKKNSGPKKARVFTVGVAVVDIIMNVDEFPDRAAKYRARDAHIAGGGCGATAAVAINRLGGDSILAARLGQDAIGEMILADLEGEGVDCRHVRKFERSRSSLSSIFVDRHGERQIVNFRDPDLPSEAGWIRDLDLRFDAVLADTRWPEGAYEAMKLARIRGKSGVLDAEAPLENADAALKAASHVMFSAQGLRAYADRDDLPAALKVAEARLGDVVGVTDGGRGIIWRQHGHERHLPAFSIDVVDTLGAGDVWHGAFALALGEAMPLEQAILFSNGAAALKCTRPGGRDGAPTRDQTEIFLRNHPTCN